MDAGTPESWRAAVTTCRACPLLAQCEQLVEMLIGRGDAPRAMIWAGVAYDNTGNVVENLDRHRIMPTDHKRPMQIIRNGPREFHSAPAITAPRRHLVLGRALKPTGTAGV
ncbi:hypothetical protein [Nocardia australiensis]|uniref:hypothetical protein n=1 Tax=Nocardia australiensis TaxID=2887191 RepID=UPI001D13CD6E|nr:hypothetical protein [Nocardia australiensis]